MSGRTLVVVLFFWALLTFITPTLVHLSGSSKIKLKPHGEGMGAMRPRKVLDYVKRQQVVRREPTILEKLQPGSIALPPAAAPAPVQGIRPAGEENRGA